MILQDLDNNGMVTLYGVYLSCKDKMNEDLKKLPKEVTIKKNITYRVFAKVVYLYFKFVFEHIINGYTYPLLNKFGSFLIVKTKCTRYIPKKIYKYRDENNVLNSEYKNCNNWMGYWYFMFWDSPKRLRQYKTLLNMKYKKEYLKKVNNGFDYIDYTLDKYGNRASPTYSYTIK